MGRGGPSGVCWGLRLIGTVLDKYEILHKLGEGGMATVYRGRHLTLGRDVAIKILHPHLSASARNRQRFAREARAIEHLDHDNILKIYDYSGNDAEDCFIVTEFVDGVTLHQLLVERGHLPSEVATIIGMKLASALDYAHQAGIIHRDIKPENVMIRRDGTIKLMDFGIARFLDEANVTMTGALVGSPAYMSPEQAMEHVLDPRSDLFSLGTVLFHLLTGQLPFAGGNPSIILRNIIENNRPEVLELAPDISGELADVVERLLQTDPIGRPQSASEVRDRLAAVLAEVKIDPNDPRWCLRAWLVDPLDYEVRLAEHIEAVLLALGKERMAAGDHLGALRLLNRLLSMKEDNPEVLALVQGMHNPPAPPERKVPIWTWAVGISALVGLTGWLLMRATGGAPTAAAVDEGTSTLAAEEPGEDLPESPLPDPPPAVVPSAPVASPSPAPPGPAPTRPHAPRDAASARSTRPSQPTTTAAPATQAQPDPPARLTVLVPGSWGNIYVDDVAKGRTGRIDGPIEVTPGTHTLRVENDLTTPWTTTFTVAPGESRTIEVTNLQRKPAVLRFPSDLAGECSLLVDEVERGTLQGLGYDYQLFEPERAHLVELRCPDGQQRVWSLAGLMPGAVRRLGGAP